MSFNLRLHPQTALLFMLDALRTSGGSYRLDLYVDSESLGGVVHQLDDELLEAKFLFAENDLVVLMGKVMEFLKVEAAVKPTAGEGVVQPEQAAASEPVVPASVGNPAALADATGVPE
jgi:hypothetical protein